MQPVVQLLLAKQEIEVLHNREAYRASIDPLTGLYNLEFLVGSCNNSCFSRSGNAWRWA